MRGRSKYRVAPKAERTGHDGRVYDSKSEMGRWYDLVMLEKAGVITDLQYHPEFKVSIKGDHFCTYTADAAYTDVKTGDWIVEDTKNKENRKDTAYKLRRKAAELFYGITVREEIR